MMVYSCCSSFFFVLHHHFFGLGQVLPLGLHALLLLGKQRVDLVSNQLPSLESSLILLQTNQSALVIHCLWNPKRPYLVTYYLHLYYATYIFIILPSSLYCYLYVYYFTCMLMMLPECGAVGLLSPISFFHLAGVNVVE